MNFLEMVKQLADELDYTPPATIEGTVSTNVRRMKNHVNRAYNHIWLQLNPVNEDAEGQTTFSTAANTETVNIPSGYNTVDQVWFGSDPPLRLLPWTEYQRYRSDILTVTDTGYPSVASIYRRKMHFYPTPDAVYTGNLRGKVSLTELAEDDDTPALRTDLHRVVFEWALAFQMEYENNPRVESQRQTAQMALQMARNQMHNHSEIPPRIMTEEELYCNSDLYWRLAH